MSILTLQHTNTYGQLARLIIAGLKEGARVLEKSGKKKQHRLRSLEIYKAGRKTSAGMGLSVGCPVFGGWHLECGAMSMKYLGVHFDIHTGGIDHIPVHHTNESFCSGDGHGKKDL